MEPEPWVNVADLIFTLSGKAETPPVYHANPKRDPRTALMVARRLRIVPPQRPRLPVAGFGAAPQGSAGWQRCRRSVALWWGGGMVGAWAGWRGPQRHSGGCADSATTNLTPGRRTTKGSAESRRNQRKQRARLKAKRGPTGAQMRGPRGSGHCSGARHREPAKQPARARSATRGRRRSRGWCGAA
jgi:hypothetical protein